MIFPLTHIYNFMFGYDNVPVYGSETNSDGRGYTFLARGSYARLLGAGVVSNDCGGGQPIRPSLAPLLCFGIQGVALVA